MRQSLILPLGLTNKLLIAGWVLRCSQEYATVPYGTFVGIHPKPLTLNPKYISFRDR